MQELTFVSTEKHRRKIRLICLPHAGGSSSVYRNWRSKLPNAIELSCIELPGHGCRVREEPLSDFWGVVRRIASEIAAAPRMPLSIFGHSFGALLAFELIDLLETSHGIHVSHLFVSGCRAPSASRTDFPLQNLPDKEFIEGISDLNGTPAALLEDQHFIQMILPALRADLAMSENYTRQSKAVSCPITAYAGIDDPSVTPAQALAWMHETTSTFDCEIFPGDHFFVNTSTDSVIRSVSSRLLVYAS